MPPRRLGKYEVLARLASGSSGHVFLARRPRVGGYAPACLKVVPRDAREEQVQALLAEGRLLSTLDHPSIVEVLELATAPVPFLVLELVVGERLDLVMDHARETGMSLPPPIAATIAQNLLDALHHAHQRSADKGAAHRDVSPPNVILSYEGQTKLLDFGIAQHDKEHATLTGLIRGRPGYMSPEQVTGARVDARTDVYAVGVILWELLANDRLHGGEAGQVAWAQRRAAPPLRERSKHVPDALAQVAQRALQRSADDRYATAAAMSEALRGYLDDATAPWGATAVARVLEERFPRRRAERRAALAALEVEALDEARVLAAFDARPVMALDLPREANPDPIPGPTQPTAVPSDPLAQVQSLEPDAASRITERGPAQLEFGDVTVAEDESTVLDRDAQAELMREPTLAQIDAAHMEAATEGPRSDPEAPEPNTEELAETQIPAPAPTIPGALLEGDADPTVMPPPILAKVGIHEPPALMPKRPRRAEAVKPARAEPPLQAAGGAPQPSAAAPQDPLAGPRALGSAPDAQPATQTPPATLQNAGDMPQSPGAGGGASNADARPAPQTPGAPAPDARLAPQPPGATPQPAASGQPAFARPGSAPGAQPPAFAQPASFAQPPISAPAPLTTHPADVDPRPDPEGPAINPRTARTTPHQPTATPARRSPLDAWQFWLVLALGLIFGIAGGAAITWTLLGP